jgi:predicted GNAT family acetyltransferase
MEFEVADNPRENRYEVRVDGELLGFAAYRLRPGLIAFTHTQIDPRLEGHGAGSQLAEAALDDARARGLAVLPFCPFINWWIEQHADYADLVPAQFRAHFRFAGSPAGSAS